MNTLTIRYLFILFLMSAGSMLGLSAQNTAGRAPQEADSLQKNVIYIHDTVYIRVPEVKESVDSSRIIRAKAIGRYNRGITNYRFLPKGKWIGGVTFSVYNYESDNSRLLFSLIKDMDINLRTLSVHPFIGYAYADNMVAGFKLGYARTSGGIGNLSLSIEDLDVSLKDIKYTNDMYSFSMFHRSYVGLDAKGIFALFNETTLGYNTGSTRFSRTTDGELKYTDTSVNQLKLGINPGIAIMVMKNIGAEVSFGVAGFTYNWEKQNKSNGETGKRHNSGANFKINLLNINIGIIVCI